MEEFYKPSVTNQWSSLDRGSIQLKAFFITECTSVINAHNKYEAWTQVFDYNKIVRFHVNNYWYSSLGPVWAQTRAQSGDWYGSGTLHPGQVLRGSLPLLSLAFRRSNFRHQVPPRPPRRERS